MKTFFLTVLATVVGGLILWLSKAAVSRISEKRRLKQEFERQFSQKLRSFNTLRCRDEIFEQGYLRGQPREINLMDLRILRKRVPEMRNLGSLPHELRKLIAYMDWADRHWLLQRHGTPP